jgi:hypothetical protein
MNKIFDFFNKISGLLLFLIFLVVLMEHLHHGHFWHKGQHNHFSGRQMRGDSSPTTLDSSGKK